MIDDIVYGKFQYNDKEYPFFLNDQIVTIVKTRYEFNNDFTNIYHFDFIKGLTQNNKEIIFLDCVHSAEPSGL